MAETSTKVQALGKPHSSPPLRLSRRGLDPGLVAAITEEGPVSRGDILQLAKAVECWVRLLPPGPLLLDTTSRVELLAGLLGSWAAERQVELGSSSPSLVADTSAASHRLVPQSVQTARMDSAAQREFAARHLVADRPLLTLLTSGSTGSARRHDKNLRHLFSEAEVLSRLLDLGPRRVVLPTVAGHHLYGLLFGVLAPWIAGATFDDSPESRPENFHPDTIARRMHAVGATHWVTIPAHLAVFADRGVELLGVREIVSSAAVLSSECARDIEQLTGARVRDILGSTETGGISSRQSSREPHWTPLPGVVVSATADSRLLVRSPFSSHPAGVPTGDRVELFADGTFLHLGREDDVVKLGGRRISLRSVEDAALAVDGVLDAVAAREVTQGLRGSRLWLFVATELTSAEVRRRLRARLEPIAVPRRIRVFPRLPRDERGKIPERVLRHLMGEE